MGVHAVINNEFQICDRWQKPKSMKAEFPLKSEANFKKNMDYHKRWGV